MTLFTFSIIRLEWQTFNDFINDRQLNYYCYVQDNEYKQTHQSNILQGVIQQGFRTQY